jgi:hypothetical protein
VEGLDPHQRAKITLEAHAELQGVQCIRGDEVVEIGDLPFDVSATQRIKAGRHGDGVQPFEFEVSPKLDPRGLCPSGHDGESSRRGHNKKWRVEIGFVNWTSANLLAVDAQDDSNFDHADFVCETTPECITCHQEDSVD